MEAQEVLKIHRLYGTQHRIRVIELLGSSRVPMTAKELHEQFGEPQPDLATVHRTLNVLEKHGIVSALSAGNRRRYLLSAGGEHGHIALCLRCGESIRLDTEEQSCPLRPEILKAHEEHHFRVVSHSVVLYGYCHTCVERCPDDVCSEEGFH